VELKALVGAGLPEIQRDGAASLHHQPQRLLAAEAPHIFALHC
jgi:hypothetical protein